MTRNSRIKAEQHVQTIVERLQQRVVDHLKVHGPQPWDTLVVELNQSRTGHIHTALKVAALENHQAEGMDGLFDGGSVKSSAG